MKLKNKLKGPWTTKKTFVVLALILIIPLTLYGINTGLRIYRLYQTVHEPLEETSEADYSDEVDFDESDEDPEELLEENLQDEEDEDLEDEATDEEDTEETDPEEEDEEEDASREDHAPAESLPGDQNGEHGLNLVPISGNNIWDYQEIDRPFYEAAAPEDNPDHLNILLLGVDEALDEPGRSDSMMVMRFNIKTEEAAILSIPRDTYIHIPGQGYDKAGHAMAYGGTALAKRTVENFFDISIDHYIRIDMGGFENSVDALGGVAVTIPERLVHENGTVLFEAGTRHLDGEDALEYTRARRLKEGDGGDHGRIRRQQQVLFEMLRKIRSELSLNEALSFMEEISPYIRTDVGPGLIMAHWGAFNRLDFQSMDIETLPGRGFIHDDIYYFRVPVENARKVMDSLAN